MQDPTTEVESLYLLLNGDLSEAERAVLLELRRISYWSPLERVRYFNIKRRCFPLEVPARHAWDETTPTPEKDLGSWRKFPSQLSRRTSS